jgi:uncharacterized membrane protein YkvA (DUF1232 family)
LTRWRILGLCQYLLGTPSGDAEQLSMKALDVFASEGPGKVTDDALNEAGAAIGKATGSTAESVLPEITPRKREEVLARLREYEALGSEAIGRAIGVLPALRERLRLAPAGALLAGIRYRLELVATVVAQMDRSEHKRCRAAAAVLYLDELQDAIPDTLGHIGLLDDDFALRVVLEELGEHSEEDRIHWAERISALWDDLPFLRGVQLRNDQGSVATTWLDRVNSYVSYTHTLSSEEKPLILVQPSVACSPLHSIVSLIGLLVLDGLTSSRDLIRSLRKGQVYEIDGKFYARFDGVSIAPAPGWLRLQFRDCTVYRPPTLADRMVAVPERWLSSGKAFSAQIHSDDAEPIQRFFNWDEAIGAASIASRVLLVTSRHRAVEMFAGMKSNGVGLLDSGIIRFAGLNPSPDVIRGGLVLVVPTLSVARQLVEQGMDTSAIVVDGYERLHRGRHDLPFLFMRPSPPSVIVWSPTGYYPSEPPSWLPQHRRLEVASDDLSYILELDVDLDESMAPGRASLWEAATGPGIEKILVPWTPEEQRLIDAIEKFIRSVRSSSDMPEYWKYHLFSSAMTLRALVAATPAYWRDIHEVACAWVTAFGEQWAELRPRAAEVLREVAQGHRRILAAVDSVSAQQNSKADALLSLVAKEKSNDWCVVCDLQEQVRVAGRLARRSRASGFEPVLLRDLGVCRSCIVVGWRSVSFGRRLWAHTPRHVIALVDDSEGKRWDRLEAQMCEREGESLLEAVGHRPPPSAPRPHFHGEKLEDEPMWGEEALVDDSNEKSRVSCVFIWLSDEPDGKVLSRDSRVLVEIGDTARERHAYRIAPEDRVILGPGCSRWSPADEFTQSVVEAIEASHPELVRDVREWRHALSKLQEDRGWSSDELRRRLEEVGVHRELQTVEGWLRLDRAAPIGPQHIRKELKAIWELVGAYTERSTDDVADACSQLRSLRSMAGRALLKLWKGRTVELGVDEAWLEELVDRLRQEVQVHEVDAITHGTVPPTMLGWWITPELASTYESKDSVSFVEAEDADSNVSEDD